MIYAVADIDTLRSAAHRRWSYSAAGCSTSAPCSSWPATPPSSRTWSMATNRSSWAAKPGCGTHPSAGPSQCATTVAAAIPAAGALSATSTTSTGEAKAVPPTSAMGRSFVIATTPWSTTASGSKATPTTSSPSTAPTAPSTGSPPRPPTPTTRSPRDVPRAWLDRSTLGGQACSRPPSPPHGCQCADQEATVQPLGERCHTRRVPSPWQPAEPSPAGASRRSRDPSSLTSAFKRDPQRALASAPVRRTHSPAGFCGQKMVADGHFVAAERSGGQGSVVVGRFEGATYLARHRPTLRGHVVLPGPRHRQRVAPRCPEQPGPNFVMP